MIDIQTVNSSGNCLNFGVPVFQQSKLKRQVFGRLKLTGPATPGRTCISQNEMHSVLDSFVKMDRKENNSTGKIPDRHYSRQVQNLHLL